MVVERRQGSTECRGGVTLDNHPVRSFTRQDRLQSRHDLRRESAQRLPGLHHVQIIVGRYRERGQYLVEHLAMLRCHANFHGKAACIAPQILNQWAQFYRLRPGADNAENSLQFSKYNEPGNALKNKVLGLNSSSTFWRGPMRGTYAQSGYNRCSRSPWMVRLFRVFIPVGVLILLISEVLLVIAAYVTAAYIGYSGDPYRVLGLWHWLGQHLRGGAYDHRRHVPV